MKKVLLGTSAIALACAYATSASAADFEVKVGGYFESQVGFVSTSVNNLVSEDYDGVDVKQDTEINFKPSITLDNGLKIGADIQLEANTSGDQIDESFLFIKGSFGEVLLGSENSAGYKMGYVAPDVTFFGVNSGDASNYIPFSGAAVNGVGGAVTTGADVFRRTLGATSIENVGNVNNDSQRITYFTPRFAGFQLGVSYAREAGQDSSGPVNVNALNPNNLIDVGANYVNSFGAFNVAVSGRWGIASDDRAAVAGTDIGKDPQVWGAGLVLGYDTGAGSVSVGGSFAEQNNSDVRDGTAFDAGISYETGPWGFSFTYFRGENVNNENAGALNNDEELQQFLLGVNYKLAKGVNVGAFGAYVDFDEETSDGGAVGGDDVDGFIIGTGIRISF